MTVGATAVIALGVFAATSGLLAQEGRSRPRAIVGDPANRLPGKTSPEALAIASGFQAFPVLWLGEEFGGFRLTRADTSSVQVPGTAISGQRLTLIYGSCTEPTPTDDEAIGCIPPIQVIVAGPGLIPNAEEIPLVATSSDVYSVRGVKARDVDLGTTLWFDNGITVTVFIDSVHRDDALKALRSANSSTLGFAEVKAGANLRPVGAIAIEL